MWDQPVVAVLEIDDNVLLTEVAVLETDRR